MLQCSDRDGIEVLLLTLKKVLYSGNDVIITRTVFQQDVFSSLGTENNPMVPNQENIEGDQSVQSHNHAQRTLQPETCEQEHCPDEAGHLLSAFQAALT